MTLHQLNSLTEDELAMAWYIANHICPTIGIEIPPHGLTWYRKDEFEKKLIAAFNHVKPENHAIYSSLLKKLGMPHEIKYTPVTQSPVTASTETPPTSSAA